MWSVYRIAVPLSYECVNNGVIKSSLYVCLIFLSCYGRTDWLIEGCVPEWRYPYCVEWKYSNAEGWRRLLTLILLTWRIGWVRNNASKWQMWFNSAFKGLIWSLSPAVSSIFNCKKLTYTHTHTHSRARATAGLRHLSGKEIQLYLDVINTQAFLLKTSAGQ